MTIKMAFNERKNVVKSTLLTKLDPGVIAYILFVSGLAISPIFYVRQVVLPLTQPPMPKISYPILISFIMYEFVWLGFATLVRNLDVSVGDAILRTGDQPNEVGINHLSAVSDVQVSCPECGTTLATQHDQIVRRRRMSPEARARMYWFVFVMWAISTAIWLWLVL